MILIFGPLILKVLETSSCRVRKLKKDAQIYQGKYVYAYIKHVDISEKIK